MTQTPSLPQDSQSLLSDLKNQIGIWAREAGFQQMGISDIDLNHESERLKDWLAQGFYGDMLWLNENLEKRLDPSELLPGTLRVISVRMNYLPENTEQIKILKDLNAAYVSRYSLGRDYHKLIRKRLANIADKIRLYAQQHQLTEAHQRAFVDSAPVLERPIAQKAGLGWIGKHTLVINKEAGSWFFLGEIFTNLELPLDTVKVKNHCGDCQACLKVCPTDAFVAPYQLDARRCISYLTIENKGSIPEEFRQAIGNRVYGCDDCQAICPWNKLAHYTREPDFLPRNQLDRASLAELFLWTEEEFNKRTEGSAIRRIGYERWLRNLAVGLGNAERSEENLEALKSRLDFPSQLVQEHVLWAINQHRQNLKRKRRVPDHKWR